MKKSEEFDNSLSLFRFFLDMFFLCIVSVNFSFMINCVELRFWSARALLADLVPMTFAGEFFI